MLVSNYIKLRYCKSSNKKTISAKYIEKNMLIENIIEKNTYAKST